MSGDIEDFLRRAAARRARRATPATPAAETPPPSQPTPPAPPPTATPVAPPNSLDTSKFDRRAARMTDVEQADDKMSAHLHEKFDHQIGTLQKSTLGEMSPHDMPSHADIELSDIAQLLLNPQSIRQAIILREILAPPHERW